MSFKRFNFYSNQKIRDTIYSKGGNITGDLSIDGDLEINGNINKNIELNNLSITDGVLNVLNPDSDAVSRFQTQDGTIFVGSSGNERFGDFSKNLIFSTGGNGLAIGTFSRDEDLVLGVDNTPIITIDGSNNQIIFDPSFVPITDPGVLGALYRDASGNLKISL